MDKNSDDKAKNTQDRQAVIITDVDTIMDNKREYASLNRWIVSWVLKNGIKLDRRMYNGREFQSLRAEQLKV